MDISRGVSWKDFEQSSLAKLSPEAAAYVRKAVNLEPDNDLRLMDREQLLKIYGKKLTKPDGSSVLALNDRKLLRTLIWQNWLQLKSKEIEPPRGNVRTYWYRQLEPFLIDKQLLIDDHGAALRKLNARSKARLMRKLGFDYRVVVRRGNPAERRRVNLEAREIYLQNLISLIFGEFVRAGVFRYQDDWEFNNPREGFYIIGRDRPRIVFATEKEGLWWLCMWANKKYGISVVASQGEPGLLSTEFLVDKLKKAKGHGDHEMRVSSLILGMLTDFDPWGWAIAENMRKKLALSIFFNGKVTLHRLDETRASIDRIVLPAVQKKYRRDMDDYSAQRKKGQIEAWGKRTGGLSLPGDPPGKYYGIHVDLADRDRLKAMIDTWMAWLDSATPEEVAAGYPNS